MPILLPPPRGPEGPQPVNLKRTAIFWLVIAAVMAASDLRTQYKDQREAAETELRQAEQELTLMYGLRSRDCLHEHCRTDQHVVYPATPADVDQEADAG